MPNFTIPVAFSVNAVDEATAASTLVDILASTDILHRWDGDRQIVEDWSMPNHQFADGSDGELELAWVERTCARTYCGEVRDFYLHKPSSECEGCMAPGDHHEFEVKEARS